MRVEDIILKWALHNAVNYKGKASLKAVAAKVFAEKPKEKKEIIFKKISEIVSEVNSLSIEEQKRLLEKFAPELLIKKVVEKKGLPELPNVKDRVVMRFAPNPNGAMSIGHARPALLNWFYVEKYTGDYILRFDDSDPRTKIPLKKAYDWFKEDLEWLGIKPSLIIKQSERLEIYYGYAKKLIEMNKAYVCTCEHEVKKRLLWKKKTCPCRELSKEEQLKRWRWMLDKKGYREGLAVLRIKTDLQNKNPAVRDWPAFRIIEHHEHPFSKAKVWPLLNFSSAIDDHDLMITHIIRGIDLITSEYRQKYIYDYFNWKYPETLYHGKFLVENIKSTSEVKKLIEEKIINDWDDPRLGTIRALRRRGFQPEAIRRFVKEAGLTRADVNVSLQSLVAFNKDLVDPLANRYFAVLKPLKLIVKNAPKISIVELDLHPDNPKRGKRKLKLSSIKNDLVFYIDESDLHLFDEGNVRLMDLFNVKFENCKGNVVYCEFIDKEKNNLPKIQWVPLEDNLKIEVMMPNASKANGFCEKSCSKIKENEVVQFVRVGFCRLDDKKKMSFWYTHR